MADYSKKVAECAAQAEANRRKARRLSSRANCDEPAAPSSSRALSGSAAADLLPSPMRVGNLIILGNMDGTSMR